jgi:hypothetical protein
MLTHNSLDCYITVKQLNNIKLKKKNHFYYYIILII